MAADQPALKTKLLIVEDSKSFSALLAASINSTNGFHCDKAETRKAAIELLADYQNEYFAAIVDLNLPDAPHGETVEDVTRLDIPVIVFTGSTDDSKKAELWSMGIADYAVKSHSHSLEYIVWMVQRIYLNQQAKILVVNDSSSDSAAMQKMLRTQNYQLLSASGSDEALKLVENNDDINLVVIDGKVDEHNGTTLATKIRDHHGRNKMEILGVSGNESPGLSSNFIKSGANDFLAKPFTPEEFLCRVNHAVDRTDNFKKLDQLNHTKNQLLGTAAHDLRGPIGAIKTASDYILSRQPAEDRRNKMLEMIQRSSGDLIHLLSELLDVSAIESGEFKLNTSPYDFAELVEERIEIYQETANKKNQNLEFQTESRPVFEFDTIKMRQVIDNLLTNAIKYSPADGKILVELFKTEKSITLSVCDSGPGIAKEEQPSLFKAFSVLSSKTTGGEKATGLGLAIAKSVVQAHGGELHYKDAKIGGACFYANIPLEM